MEVHSQLGHGFLEPVYQQALALKLTARKISYTREPELPIVYKSQRLEATYRPDFICYGEVVVELRALSGMSGAEESQVINYLKASGLHTGLLINFGKQRLEYRRFVS